MDLPFKKNLNPLSPVDALCHAWLKWAIYGSAEVDFKNLLMYLQTVAIMFTWKRAWHTII